MPLPTRIPAPVSPASTEAPRVAPRRPWSWRPLDQTLALSNARLASIELSRRRVEREAVGVYLAKLAGRRAPRRAAPPQSSATTARPPAQTGR